MIHNNDVRIVCSTFRVSVFVRQLSLLWWLDHQPRVDRVGRALRKLIVSARSLCFVVSSQTQESLEDSKNMIRTYYSLRIVSVSARMC